MNELKDCVKDKKTGKTYCWDSELQSFVEVIIKPLDIHECPACVIKAVMQKHYPKETEVIE